MGGYTDLGACVWNSESVQVLGYLQPRLCGDLNMEGTGNEAAQPRGEGPAGPGMRGIQATERGWCMAAREMRLQAEGVQAQVRGCAGPRDGGKGVWGRWCRPGVGTLGLRSGLASKLTFPSPIASPQRPIRTPLGRV